MANTPLSVVPALKTVKILNMKAGESTPTADQLKLINVHTRRELTADEVYIYPILLCDNEIDRDTEYFEKDDLEALASLAPGVTGIFDHKWSSGGQVARLFAANVEVDGSTNSRGVQYHYLKGWAYILRLDKYADLIAEIDGGIKKEVSIGFSYTTPICSICGGDYRDYDACQHIRGRVYNKEVCAIRMAGPKEMYEYSHVAVPAQPAAGALKGMGIDEERLIAAVTADKSAKLTGGNPPKTKDNAERDGDEVNLAETLKTLGVEVKDDAQALDTIKQWQTKAGEVDGLKQQVNDLTAKAANGDQYISDLKADALRLGALVDKGFNAETMEKIFDKCSVDELKTFIAQYKAKEEEMFPPVPQSKAGGKEEKQVATRPEDNDAYKV